MNNYIVGLDIGTTKVCTVVSEIGEGGLEIKGIGLSPSQGLKRGVVVDINKAAASIDESIKRAEAASGISIKSAYVGVTGSHISCINTKGVLTVSHPKHEITEVDKDRVIKSACIFNIPPNKEVIHIIPREFILDGEGGVADPAGMSAYQLEVKVLIILGSITALQNLVKSVRLANLEVEDIVLQSLASSEAVLTEEEKEIGTILADIGGGTTDLAVFYKDGVWYTSAIPIAGKYVSQDIAIGLKISMEEAEKIKLEHGTVSSGFIAEGELLDISAKNEEAETRLSKKKLAEIIESRIKEIFNLTRLELENLGLSGKLFPGGIVITGGSAQIKGLPFLASKVLDTPARIGFPDGLGEGIIKSPIYASGVGLVRYGMKHRETTETIKAGGKKLVKDIVERIKGWFSNLTTRLGGK